MVDTIKPDPRGPFTRSDGGTGLNILVHPTGTKTYIWRWRVGPKFRKLTIGRCNAMKVEDARSIALGYTNAVKQGRDPVLEQRAEKQKKKLTVSEAWKLFDEKRLSERKERTRDEYDCIFRKDAEAVLGSTLINAVNRNDLEDRLEEVLERSKGGALLLYRVLSSFFSWCAKKPSMTGLESNPMATVAKPCDDFGERSRNLDAQEVRWLLLALRELRQGKGALARWSAAVEVLLRLSQRDGNVTRMHTTSIKRGVLHISRGGAKNNMEHALPLPKQVLDIIEQVERPDLASTLVFQRLHHKEHHLNLIREKVVEVAKEEVEHWTLHDLRRTFNTLIFDEFEDADFFTIESILGHKLKGVSKHYNFAKLLKRKQRHLQWWNDWLDHQMEEEQRLAA